MGGPETSSLGRHTGTLGYWSHCRILNFGTYRPSVWSRPSRRRRRRPVSVRLSRRPSRRQPSSVRPSRRVRKIFEHCDYRARDAATIQ